MLLDYSQEDFTTSSHTFWRLEYLEYESFYIRHYHLLVWRYRLAGIRDCTPLFTGDLYCATRIERSRGRSGLPDQGLQSSEVWRVFGLA